MTSRNRIDRMGGFKEYMMIQRQRDTWDDSQEQQQSQSQEEQKQDEEEEISEDFTMEIMLKLAGVDERIIGWDRELNNFKKT